ncbi:MAG: sulfatase-like hydrolase/transferase, partial [Bacteroidia bacterium]|nr:sulfatase-like hydrolase/transferase [Bacteroidia bacterium]
RGDYWRKGLCSEDFVIPQTLDIIADKAANYISNYKSDKPYFVYLPLTAPHTPWLPAEKFRGKSGAGVYGDFVCHVDDVVGRILDAVEKTGKSENTLIIFTSDNGSDWKMEDLAAFPKHQANYIFKGEKSDIWDGGHHIPFLVRWPNVVKKGSVSKALVCLTDFTGTCAEITGQKLKEGDAEDSFSMYSIFKGKSSSKTTRKDLIHHGIFGMFSIRQGEWKFVDGEGSGGWSDATDSLPGQLYNMKKDPSEKVNLYTKYPEKVEKLKQRLEVIKNVK